MLWHFVWPTGVNLFDFFCSGIQFLYVHSSIAIILMGKRELIALLGLLSWCLMMVERLFLAESLSLLYLLVIS